MASLDLRIGLVLGVSSETKRIIGAHENALLDWRNRQRAGSGSDLKPDP